ncbi:MAG TPA: hypothetical protein VIL09_06690 [Microvirga sp.]|jgi:hypothetical protein
MLNRLHDSNCIVCGKAYGDPQFGYQYGRIENGPAYWSDRGLLCSIECSMEHRKQRLAAGDPMRDPAPNPLERTRR